MKRLFRALACFWTGELGSLEGPPGTMRRSYFESDLMRSLSRAISRCAAVSSRVPAVIPREDASVMNLHYGPFGGSCKFGLGGDGDMEDLARA